MIHERMFDKDRKPERKMIAEYLGNDVFAVWNDITLFLECNYTFDPETIFGGNKYGWLVRYRKSGKTLCALYPEINAFTFQIVLGLKESQQTIDRLNEFTPAIAHLIQNTDQLHDGKWLWIQVTDREIIDDIKRLIQIKKPIKHTAAG